MTRTGTKSGRGAHRAVDGQVVDEVPFGARTTFQVGGTARFGVRARTTDELRAALHFAAERGLPTYAFGEGSNTLVSDRGFDGLLIEVVADDVRFSPEPDAPSKTRVRAAAGCSWDRLVRFCVARELAGVECLSGIPGVVGAAPIQNVGAYGQDVADTIDIVHVLDTHSHLELALPAAACGFGYRTSRFKTSDRGRYIVLGVDLLLEQRGQPNLSYRDLATYFDHAPSLGEARAAVLEIRGRKSMVLNSLDPDSRSAGSFFVNPIVPNERARELTARWRALHQATGADGDPGDIPTWPVGTTHTKIPAAWLIERAGLLKGHTQGHARISRSHTLALVALPDALAHDVVALAQLVQRRVAEAWGLQLHAEPNLIGFDANPLDPPAEPRVSAEPNSCNADHEDA